MSVRIERQKQREEWAAIIRKKRKALGLTQEQLVRKGDGFGLSHLQKIENGGYCSEEAFLYFSGLLKRNGRTA